MSKKIKAKEIIPLIILAILIAATVIAIVMQKESEKMQEVRYGYFDTVTVLTDYRGEGEDKFRLFCDAVDEDLAFYHKLFNIYDTYDGITNIAVLNERAGEGPTKVSEELFDFLKYCKDIYSLTDGEVNICMGAVLRIWHDARENALNDPITAAIPSPELLSSGSEHCNIDDLILDGENMTVELRDPEMSLDVGAIAKGYAVERIAERLVRLGISGVTLDVGGNLRLVGEKPSGDGWLTGIENPDKTSHETYIQSFTASDTSVVTSGDYQRYFIVEGKKYHHIIDKDTLRPAEHFASVSVVCFDSGLADALSTALFCMSYEDGLSLLRGISEIERVVWVSSDGTVLSYGE